MTTAKGSENKEVPRGTFFKKPVIFMSENVTLVGTEVNVVLNYDTWASHSSISQSLEKFITDLNFEGDLLIQQFGNVIPQEKTYTGMISLKQMNKKLRCMINRQKLHTIEQQVVEVPEEWQKEHNLKKMFQNAVGPVQLVIGTDNLALHPTRVSVIDGIVLNKSNITGNYLLAGCSNKGDPSLQKEVTIAGEKTKMMKKAALVLLVILVLLVTWTPNPLDSAAKSP